MSKVIFNTSGDGYWSRVFNAQVRITDMVLGKATLFEGDTDKDMFGELRVYFDKHWDTRKDGLIYTDGLFLEQLKAKLTECGFNATDVGYSEQGMQGNNYVSLDVGDKFLKSWLNVVDIRVE